MFARMASTGWGAKIDESAMQCERGKGRSALAGTPNADYERASCCVWNAQPPDADDRVIRGGCPGREWSGL